MVTSGAAAVPAIARRVALDGHGEGGAGKVRRWNLCDFDVGAALGHGKYGVVYRAALRRTGELCALKVLDKEQLSRDHMCGQLGQEVEIHSRLKHPNIVQLYGYFYDPKRIYLVLELCGGGELYKAMKREPGGKFQEPVAARYIAQLASALAYCHSFNVIHRDVKPENLLLGSDGLLKLADFGWAAHDRRGYNGYLSTAQDATMRAINLGNRRTTFCGTLDYIAPEMVRGCAYDEMVDNWTVGVLSYELLVGVAPFDPSVAGRKPTLGDAPFGPPAQPNKPKPPAEARINDTPKSFMSDNEATFRRISQLDYELPESLSPAARDLIRRLLHERAEHRLSLLEVQQHPWILKHCRPRSD